MIVMNYRINLPNDYDMNIIRKRIADNGSKTDGFRGLLFKCYLIQEKNLDSFENIYSPLYIWNDSDGMNEFIFGGFYDNIIKSFGWQRINIGVPFLIDFKDNFKDAKFVVEETNDIMPQLSLSDFIESVPKSSIDDEVCVGRLFIYNPDKWKYSKFYFYLNRPNNLYENNIYQILHISKGE